MPEFLTDLPREVWLWTALITLGTLITSAIVFPMIIIRMGEDYFLPDRPHHRTFAHGHPVLRWVGLGLKNLAGGVLLLAGIIMCFTPGQGLLTIFTGLVLLDFPGKRKLELRLVSRPKVFQALNWIRAKANRPPLQLPPES